MQPDKTFRTLRGSQEFSNGNRRGIRGEDRIFLHHAVQRGVDLFLLVDVLNYGLNDDVAISQILLAGRALKAAADHLRTFLERALLGKLGQRFLNPRKSFIEIFLLNFEHSDIETSRGRNLRDTRTHEATAQHANFLDFHKTGEFISGNVLSATFACGFMWDAGNYATAAVAADGARLTIRPIP